MKSLMVDLGERRYPIVIGRSLLKDADLLTSLITSQQALIVTNETLAPLYLSTIKIAISNIKQLDCVILPDGERYKNLETVNAIYDCLLEKKHNRSTTLIALGGGVIGDMTGFAAATYQRGVAFIQIPTTLLAQVDSSVGGKTGVNHVLGKNMIGAFHQPKAVLIDIDTLKTLPPREFSAGLAEIIKYGLINDAEFFVWLEQNMSLLMERDYLALTYAIERSCHNKAVVVAADERETGQRALLNLGHTFGHAIEAHQGYRQWLHGEAVAAGMIIAAQTSHQLGWLASSDLARIKLLLIAAGLPVRPPQDMSSSHFFDKMQVDKKITKGKIRYILLHAIGEAVVVDSVDHSLVAAAIEAVRFSS